MYVRRGGTGEVMPPQWPNLVLSAYIPNIEFRVFVRDGLDVEADGGDGGDVLLELKVVQDGCGITRLASVLPMSNASSQ